MKTHLLSFLLLLFITVSCAEAPLDPSKPVYATIQTTMGDVTVLLYDDTPLHRDNFIKLCRSGEYEGMLFHRIIHEFVVQGGDPASKAHEPDVMYGDGNGGYTVPAEIRPNHFNKRGALIDAKESDEVNPDRASAGTQFCFVQGKVLTDEELDQRETQISQYRRNWLFYKFRDRLKKEDPSLATDKMQEELENRVLLLVQDTLELLGPATIPPVHREVYKTIGGVPHLDGMVTIFGEVTEGLDIVEKMSKVKTGKYDRPVSDVLIVSTSVFQK